MLTGLIHAGDIWWNGWNTLIVFDDKIGYRSVALDRYDKGIEYTWIKYHLKVGDRIVIEDLFLIGTLE